MIKEITEKELLDLLLKGQINLVDVREMDEISKSGKLQNAQHWPLSSFGLRKSDLSKTLPTVFCCLSGMRSLKAAEIAELWTDQPIYTLQGGIMGCDSLK